ncbi:MAG: hypothetical protein ACLT76_05145 [Clostridium fessum]
MVVWGIDFQEDSLKEGYIQLYPGVHPCDGFFHLCDEKKRITGRNSV